MSWTAFSVSTTVIAAGFLATMPIPAWAGPVPETRSPGTSRVPGEIGVEAPVHTCGALRDLRVGLDEAPCVDTDLSVRVPNPARKACADLASGVRKFRRAPQDVAPAEVTSQLVRAVRRTISDAPAPTTLINTRPTVDLAVRPRDEGVLEPKAPHGHFLALRLKQRADSEEQPELNTVARLYALHGYATRLAPDPVALTAPVLKPLRHPCHSRPSRPGNVIEDTVGAPKTNLFTTVAAVLPVAEPTD